jgi:tetratricopeptide (TPR) repeat protein
MEKLKALFMAGKMEEVGSEARKMVNDPAYRYIDFEGNFIEAGRLFLKRKQTSTAIQIFEMNTGLFPSSIRSWLGLADAYAAAGQKEKALDACRKVVSLDPGGAGAAEAKKKIQELQAGN